MPWSIASTFTYIQASFTWRRWGRRRRNLKAVGWQRRRQRTEWIAGTSGHRFNPLLDGLEIDLLVDRAVDVVGAKVDILVDGVL